jgi:hypothetical protein
MNSRANSRSKMVSDDASTIRIIKFILANSDRGEGFHGAHERSAPKMSSPPD